MKRYLLLVLQLLWLSACQDGSNAPIAPQAPKPIASFTINNNGCTADCAITFTNTSQNATSFQWDFGDGVPGSTDKDGRRIYVEGASYPVSLTATGLGGSHTVSQTATVKPGPIRWYMGFPDLNTLTQEVMVRIEGGTFQMGNPQTYSDFMERPVHSVTVSSFYLAQHEVNQRQWKAIMGTDPSYFKNCDNCPVESVSWEDAQKFLEKLNQRRLPGTPAFRLPTEAEWEYAAGGGTTSVRFLFGNGTSVLDPRQANFKGSEFWRGYSVLGEYRAKTVPVGSFKPSFPLILYDMSGNVAEWCADHMRTYDSKPQTNPTGPATGDYRVFRGGGWSSHANECRASYRFSQRPFERPSFIGFRIASDATY